MRFCMECNDKKMCNDSNNQINENKEFKFVKTKSS